MQQKLLHHQNFILLIHIFFKCNLQEVHEHQPGLGVLVIQHLLFDLVLRPLP